MKKLITNSSRTVTGTEPEQYRPITGSKSGHNFFKTLLTITLFLTLGMGNAWGWYYITGDLVGGWDYNNPSAGEMINENRTFYNVEAGTYYFKVTNGTTASGSDVRATTSGNISTGWNGKDAMYVVVSENTNLTFHLTSYSTWKVDVSGVPAYYFKYNWGGSGSWAWCGDLYSNGDGTYSTEGKYRASNADSFDYNYKADDSGKTNSSKINVSGNPTDGEQCFFTYDPSDHSLTIQKKNTVTATNYIYFDNTQSGWTESSIQFVVGHLSYTRTNEMSSVLNTNLYYVDRTTNSWTDAYYYAMISRDTKFDDGAYGCKNIYDAPHYSSPYHQSFNMENTHVYLVEKASADNDTPITLTDKGANNSSSLNSTQTIQYALSTNNGVSYSIMSEGNTPGTIEISSYEFVDDTYDAVSATEASIYGETDETYSTTVNAAYTGTTTLSATASTGYTFVGWKIGDTETAASSPCYPTSATTYTARFKANQYSITYKDKGNETFSGTLVDAPETHTYGIATDLVIPTKANYSFGGWWTDATCTTTRVGTELAASLSATGYTANITLYARWDEIVSLPDTLNKDNLVAYGEKLQFSGDTLDYSHGNNNHRDGYADWKVDIEKCVYTVTIGGRYPNGHNWKLYLISGSDTLSTCDFGDKNNTGWATETKTWNLSGLTSAGVYTIRAKNIRNWGDPRLLYIAMDPITVTYDANGGSCATASQVYAGSALTLPTPDSRSGYVFEGWYSGNTKIGGAGGSYSPTASITLTARWGKILNMPNTFTKDNVATYCDEMTWYGDDDEYFDFGPSSAHNLDRWAKWEVHVVPCEYTVSVVVDFPNGHGWGLALLDANNDTIAKYNSITNNDTKEKTYSIKWDLTKDINGDDLAEGTYTLGVKNIYKWAQPKLKSLTLAADEYTISYSAGTYGSGSLANGTKIACQDYTLSSSSSAFTRNYYTYDGWAESDGGDKVYNLGGTYSTDAAVTLYPHWELDCGTLYAPSALAASDILDVSATLTITDDYDAPSYEIYYSTSSTAPTSGTTATTTSTSKTKTITGLTASTTYYAWVRAVCDGSHKTDWVAITDGSFSTVATVYAVTIGTVTTNQHSGTTVGGTISASASSAAAGANVTLTATPVSGFGFVRWQIVNDEEEDVTSTVLDGNTLTMPAYGVTVNATFATRYPIYYKEDDNETTIPGLEPTYYLYGVGVPTLPTPEKTGYRFDAWYNKWCVINEEKGFVDGCTKTSVSTTTYGDYIFLAKWTAVEDITEDCWDNGEYKCGDVPNFNTPNPEGTGNWGTASNWGGGKAPDEDTYVVLPNSITIAAGDVAIANTIVLEDNADLTIADGGALIVENGIEQGSGSDITLGSSIANGNATLIYDISEGLNATVKMASKATTTGSDWTWQYIGSPVNGIHAEDMYHGGYLYKWINGTGWSAVAAKAELEAFAGYCVSYPNADGHTFTMSGELTEIEETSIPVAAGTAQVIGNSWTAPIQIAQMEASDFNQVDQTIYLFNTGSDVDGTGGQSTSDNRYAAGTYVTVPIAEALSIGVTKVSALQGFFVKNETNTNGYITLSYSKHVRPTSGGSNVINGPMHAPKRIIAEQEDQAAVAILTVSGTRYDDQLFLIERDNCTDGYDAGHDGEKIGESSVSPWIYALRADGTHDAVSATDDLEGTVIGFRAGTTDSQYTMHFDYSDEAEELYLYDTETNTYTQVLTDNTYTFTTTDKEEHARFTLLRANAPQIATGVENVQSDDVQCTKARKVMIDGELYLMYKGTMYNVQGAKVK